MANVTIDSVKLAEVLDTLLEKVYVVRGLSYAEASVLIGVVDGKQIRLSVMLPDDDSSELLERFNCLKGGA